ncbi:bile acid:sodium symporter family protein [Alteromonas sediminis]|uniref:Bile acid:sodium symporter family protein n=1 Tax=Alteromonas sediminis TaxID=2259342 RepID=A0A3N5Y3Q1_9ALTE|nr:bile acid:sodium symporter [Alteromonas sediminis]RPJ68697.1 bile acid:sodium symporter family protein [Alteromonas sediminis]
MLDSFVRFYLENEYSFAATQLALAMLGMGATLRVADFVRVVRFPFSFFTGMGVQIVGVFLVVLLLMNVLDLATGLVIGLALCAAVPGGTTSNIFTHLARGNTALSVTLTTVCSIACLVTAPVILGLLLVSDLPDDFSMPAATIATDIVVNLLVPLALGMLILKHLPKVAGPVSVWSIRVSLLIIVGIVVGAAGAGRLDLAAFGMGNFAIIVAFIMGLLVMSTLVPILCKREGKDVMAITMEVTVRNINLGLLIHVALFAGGNYPEQVANQALLAMLLYGALQMLLCIPVIIVGRFCFKA